MIPVVAASFIGGIVSALAQFAISRAGMIIAGLGFTFVGVKSMEAFIGYVVSDMNSIVSMVNGMGGAAGPNGIGHLASTMMQIAAYAGLFDALNIIISGYMSYASLVAIRFLVARLK